jgi:hypothetical protein
LPALPADIFAPILEASMFTSEFFLLELAPWSLSNSRSGMDWRQPMESTRPGW